MTRIAQHILRASMAAVLLLLMVPGCGNGTQSSSDGGRDTNQSVDDSGSDFQGDGPSADGPQADGHISDGARDGDTNDGVGGDAGQLDPAITTNSASMTKALAYEQQFFAALKTFRDHLLVQWGAKRLSDADARKLTYSSGWGLAAYHTLDELWSLSFVLDVTNDASHRDQYAALAKEVLDISVPAIKTGKGTTGCGSNASLYQCSDGYFRYLDASHGASAAGFVMNAIYQNPVLRQKYLTDLTTWANDLVPTLERHIKITQSPNSVTHMPAKLAPALLAVGKILGKKSYIDAFNRVTDNTLVNIKSNSGWIGSDRGHAAISVAALQLAYREQLRATIPAKVTEPPMTGVGEALPSSPPAGNPAAYSGSLVGVYGVLVRLSSTVMTMSANTYTVSGSVGGHTMERFFESLAGLALGHATRIASDGSLP